MKLYIIQWQQGFGLTSIYYLSKKNAQTKYEEIKTIFEKHQQNEATAVNYDLVSTLVMEEIITQDEEFAMCSFCNQEFFINDRKNDQFCNVCAAKNLRAMEQLEKEGVDIG